MVRIPQGARHYYFGNLDTDASVREKFQFGQVSTGVQTWLRTPHRSRSKWIFFLSVGRHGTPSQGWIYLHYEHDLFKGSHVARFNLSWIAKGVLTGDGSLPDLAE